MIALINLLPKLADLSLISSLRVLELPFEVLELKLILPSEFRSLPALHSLLFGNPILQHLQLSQQFLPLLLEIPKKSCFLIRQGLAFVPQDVIFRFLLMQNT